MPKLLEELLKLKRVLKSKITRVTNAISDLLEETEFNVERSDICLRQISELNLEVSNLFKDILITCEEESYSDYETELFDLSNKLDSFELSLKKRNSSLTNQQSQTSVVAESQKAYINLPKLDLPTFSGDLFSWISFRDLFSATVINNELLSNSQKLQYLKLSVKGEALSLINSISISDANFEKAWAALINRYHNEVDLVYCHLDKLFTQPGLQLESSKGLRKLLDLTSECLDNLRTLNQPVDNWNSILVYMLRRKLDHVSLKEWELSQAKGKMPTFEEFRTFLEMRARALESTNILPQRLKVKAEKSRAFKVQISPNKSESCIFCDGPHIIYRCDKFTAASIQDRNAFVLARKLCRNCLKPGHNIAACKSRHCRFCSSKHHSLLHNQVGESNSVTAEYHEVKSSAHCSTGASFNPSILPTALVRVYDSFGTSIECRALIDSGSESSFISEDCVQRLRLRKFNANISLSGLSAEPMTKVKSFVKTAVGSKLNSEFRLQISALVLPKVTSALPQHRLSIKEFTCFQRLQLADPHFNQPNKIDLLLGADAFPAIFLGERRKPAKMNVAAFKTVFGWVLTGKLNFAPTKNITNLHVTCCDINKNLQAFWELDKIPSQKALSESERYCEESFITMTTRNREGRFIVKLPFKESSLELGASRDFAIQRLKSSERRFKHNSDLENSFKAFMREYKSLEHMELVPKEELLRPVHETYYLPHHAVIKCQTSRTKFRVVFDASAKSSNGMSLNDKLLVGPVVQDSLASILTRFRMHQVAIVADIEKMYRQFNVDSRDMDYQRIVWRDSSSDPIQDWRLRTITYGTASAAYQATRCLKQLALDEAEDFPRASLIVQRDFYVDDLMSGADSEAEALQLQQEIISLLKRGCLELKKWASNVQKVIQAVEPPLREIGQSRRIDADDSIKTLGLQWQLSSDCFSFDVVQNSTTSVTKRYLLSELSKIFDPLGWLSPVTIKGKILLQELWRKNLDWDQPLPELIQQEWNALVSNLNDINLLKIPRCMVLPNSTKHEILGFCDASEKAYASVVYLRTTDDQGNSITRLALAKTKVAPLKPISLPRLELCGSLLLARAIRQLLESISLESPTIHCWTDSKIVLAWVRSDPSKWKTFVANRVSKIQDLIPHAPWYHIKSEHNPADCASRGISPIDLYHHSLWWTGPERSNIDTNSLVCDSTEETQDEAKPVKALHSAKLMEDTSHFLLTKFSSLTKIKRVLAYCKRFVSNTRSGSSKQYGFLKAYELEDALLLLIRQAQQETFQEEIATLAKRQNLSCNSKIAPLNPFLDEQGILRVGGRLRHSKLLNTEKYPILLPKHHRLTDLILSDIHLKYLHAGPQLMLSIVIRKYWIIAARDVVRKHVRKCVICCRHRAQTMEQLMGDLPRDRTLPCKAFQKCGVDYAGPFSLKASKGRGRITYKGYIALFVCFVTRAIHLELVGDMTSDAFIAALKRFISRRGQCTDLYSDCGTNFVGASKTLEDDRKWLAVTDQGKIAHQLADNNINWHFNPPSAPHMGGLWEAGIKSVKYHLRRIVGNTILSYEEFYTLLVQIEACLNSRPITPMSSDPNDLAPLTPGHFLTGQALTSVPEKNYTSLPNNRLSRWHLLQKLTQTFWSRWKSEYLSRLQNRPKWYANRQNIQVGDLVIIKNDNLPPLKWSLGRVIQTFPGLDGKTRVVSLKTADGEIKRPIVKLCLLPSDN